MDIKGLCFDDVLINPSFSTIKSRKDVDVSTTFLGQKFELGIVSANMDTITGIDMAHAMAQYGARACLHRFSSIEENVKDFNKALQVPTIPPTRGMMFIKPMVSVGISDNEFERACALIDAGAEMLLIDVAHGAQMSVVSFYNALRDKYSNNIGIVVGNFANAQSINDFNHFSNHKLEAVKIGIGGGSACLTRVVTGCGMPTLASLLDCVSTGVPMISDGGHRNSGDVCKAIAAGAKLVMLGGMLAGTDETPGEVLFTNVWNKRDNVTIERTITIEEYTKDCMYGEEVKKYRGSASAESYQVQGKTASHRAAEGDSFLVPYKGAVKEVLQSIEGGLRSAMTYTNSRTIDEFQRNVDLIAISSNSVKESSAHGKK